jgi:hypothetical protein
MQIRPVLMPAHVTNASLDSYTEQKDMRHKNPIHGVCPPKNQVALHSRISVLLSMFTALPLRLRSQRLIRIRPRTRRARSKARERRGLRHLRTVVLSATVHIVPITLLLLLRCCETFQCQCPWIPRKTGPILLVLMRSMTVVLRAQRPQELHIRTIMPVCKAHLPRPHAHTRLSLSLPLPLHPR